MGKIKVVGIGILLLTFLPQANLFSSEIPQILAFRTEKPPIIDGKFTDECWQESEWQDNFQLRNWGGKAKVQTSFSVVYDDKNLYFAFRCNEPEMKKLKMLYVKRDDPVWKDDCIEIFLDTRTGEKILYHFIVNAAGVIADRKQDKQNWNAPGAKAGVQLQPESWQVEFLIPFKDLGVNPKPGEEWGLKIGRERRAGKKELSLWAEQPGSFNFFGHFGRLIFGGKGIKGEIQVISWGKLFLGAGNITLKLKNPENISAATIKTMDKNQQVIYEKHIPLKKEKVVYLPYIIKSDRERTITLTLFNNNGEVCFVERHLLPYPEIGLEKTIGSIKKLSSFLPLLSEEAKVVKELRKEINAIQGKISSFQKTLKEAIKEGRSISPAEWESIKEVVEHFKNLKRKLSPLVWQKNPWEDITPHDIPANLEPIKKVQIRMAKNEYESAVILLSNLIVPEGLDIRVIVPDLKEKKTSSLIPNSNIQVREAVFVRNNHHQLIPDALVGNDINRFQIPFGKTRLVWLTIHTPEDIPSGKYRGEMVIKPIDVEKGEPALPKKIPLEVEVWDFSLPERLPIDAYIFTTIPVPPSFGKSGGEWVYGWNNNKKYVNKNTAYPKDFSSHLLTWGMSDLLHAYGRVHDIRWDEEYVKELRKQGMKVMYSYGGGSVDFCIRKAKELRSMGLSYEDFCFQVIDEPGEGEKRTEKAVARAREIKKKNPNIQLSVTLGGTSTLKVAKQFAPYIDIWIPHLGKFFPETERGKKLYSFLRSTGKPIWTYQCSNPMDSLDIMDYYRLYPWKVWKLGLDGCAYWIYDGWVGDPWDVFDVKHPKHTGSTQYDNGMIYSSADKNKVIDSRRWEAFREGLEDYEYLYILKERAEKYDRKDVKEWLEKVVRDVLSHPEEPQILERWRERIAQEIMRISPQK